MEAAGITLAAVALLVPVYHGYQTLGTLFRDTSNCIGDWKRLEARFSTQSIIFNQECQIVLMKVVNEDMMIAMLKDKDHPQWTSPEFQTFSKTLGDFFNIPLKITREILEEIEKELSKIKTSSGLKLSRREKLMDFNRRIRLALSQKKTRIGGLIDELGEQNRVLRRLREQQAQLQKPPKRTRKPTSRLQPVHPKPTTTQALAIRDIAKQLYDRLSKIAVCSCHCVNLQLCSQLTASDSSKIHDRDFLAPVNFSFVVTALDTTGDGCMCLRVTSEKSGPIGRLRELSSIPTGTLGARVEGSSRIGAVVPASQQLTYTNSETNDPPSRPTTDVTLIEDLCSILKPSVNSPSNDCLGRISDTDIYRHLIYREPEKYESISQTSLSDFLQKAHVDNRQTLPREERLKIAFILSLSILQFGSYSTCWFQEYWRSCDIYFFQPGGQQGQVSRSIDPMKDMHIKSFSGGAMVSSTIGGERSGVIPNEQLFSLAIVLIELGYGKSLSSIHTSKKIAAKGEFLEYIKVKHILDFDYLVQEMGPRYAEAVQRCFSCRFGDNAVRADLTKEELQEIFYTEVVCELKHCWETFRFPA